MARSYTPNHADDDSRMRPGSKGRPGGNIVDAGYAVKGELVWQRMAGNASNPATRPAGRLKDPNTKDKVYVSGNER